MPQNYVITLMVNPNNCTLTEQNIQNITDIIQANAGNNQKIEWLAPAQACDFYFIAEPSNISALQQQLADYAQEIKADYSLLSTEHRKKKLLISDMDSTMIEQECIDELASAIGIGEKVAAITERAMCGELDFVAALEERVGLLKGLDKDKLRAIYHSHITFSQGAKTVVSTMKKHGSRAVLVSGGFTFFTSHVAQALGFDVDEANQLDFDAQDKLSGKVVYPVLDKQAKLDTLNKECAALKITAEEVLAVGDGANDLPMIEAAGLGVSYRGKPIVQENAKASINHTDLTSLLYMQGYKKTEFV